LALTLSEPATPVTVSALVQGPEGLEVMQATVASAASAEGLVDRLVQDEDVVAADIDTTLALAAEPMRSQQWGLDRLDAEQTWTTTTGAGTVVAVIDSGVDGAHPDLAAALVPGLDTLDPNQDGSVDTHGHGTAVAGVVGARLNGVGMVGIAPDVGIMPIRVVGTDGLASSSNVARGILWAVDNGADVINLSLGAPESNAVLTQAIDTAMAAGVVVVAAAGNLGEEGNPTVYPAAQPGVLAVAATMQTDLSAPFSGSGSWVDISAPGVQIVAPMAGGGYGFTHGTSMASPFVSGAAALVLSQAPDLSTEQVVTQLTTTAVDVGAQGFDNATGHGVVAPDAALADLPNADPRPGPEPTPAPGPTPVPVPTPSPSPTSTPRPRPSPSPTEAPGPEPVTVGHVGADVDVVRAAIDISAAAFPGDGGARHAVLSRSDAFADSLAGTALAGRQGPILFTDGGASAPLRAETAQELNRVLRPGATLYILGGTNAVSATAEADAQALGYEVRRLAGPSRIETALAIATEVDPSPSRVLLARADGWADAVTGGAYAASSGVPVLLTGSDQLAPPVAAALSAANPEVILLGGRAALSDEVAAASGATVRVAGDTRAGTAVAVSRTLWGRTAARPGATYVLVEGWQADSWAPALAASVLSAVRDAPQLLLDGNSPTPPAETAAYLTELGHDVNSTGGALLVGPALTQAHDLALMPLLGL
jgi:type VII secretion-associated serine protease mycosin